MKTRHSDGAFTVVEVLIVLLVLGMILGAAAPSIYRRIERINLDEERRRLAIYEEDIRRTFTSVDFTNRNIASFAGAIGVSDTPTAFSASVFPSYPASAANLWVVKLGLARGVTPQLGLPIDRANQRSLYDIAFNLFDQPRLMMAGPSNEADWQRYMVISVMAPSSKGLVIPTNDGSQAWFDEIWNNNWAGDGAVIPVGWSARLTPTQLALWGSAGAWKCIVQKIVQPKFSITVNNNHPTNNGWIDVNGQTAAMTAAPNSGPNTILGVLLGRRVTLRTGASAPGIAQHSFNIDEQWSYTLQLN